MQLRLLPLLSIFAASCSVATVAHEQPDREANRIQLLLHHYGIPADKQDGGDARHPTFDVVVPKSYQYLALQVLEDFNLPRSPTITMKDLVADAGLIPSSDRERARLELGLMGDIVDALLDFPLITDAHAAVTLPKREPLADLDARQPRPKASVVLEYASAGDPPVSSEAVQAFVGARVPEIEASEVSVNWIRKSPPAASGTGCIQKTRVFGIDVCAGDEQRFLGLVISAVSFAGVLAALTMFAMLRTLRYRRELTRLTAKHA